MEAPCSKCGGQRDRQNAYCSQCLSDYYRETETRQHRQRLLKVYGITLEEFEAALERQSGVCGICKRKETRGRLSVDHEHSTGRFRGLLCRRCNRGVGVFQDDPILFEAGKEYLSNVLR